MAKVRQTAPPPSDSGAGRTTANADEEDVSDDDQNDGNATDVRSKDRQNQEMEYVGEDEEMEEIGDVNGSESGKYHGVWTLCCNFSVVSL